MSILSSESLIDLSRLSGLLGALAHRVDVEALVACSSTNALLMQRISATPARVVAGAVLVTDRQTAGRGRRGRAWISAVQPEASLTFSLLWRFQRGTVPAGLSLAVGVALAEALGELGYAGIRLKWPNDLLAETPGGLAKLGGILIELTNGVDGLWAVIGVGLNIETPTDAAIDQAAVGLNALAAKAADRHEVLASALRCLVSMLDRFSMAGFAGLRDEWQARNVFAGQAVRLIEDSGRVFEGRCMGVDNDGALLVESADGSVRWLAGDVSLRAG